MTISLTIILESVLYLKDSIASANQCLQQAKNKELGDPEKTEMVSCITDAKSILIVISPDNLDTLNIDQVCTRVLILYRIDIFLLYWLKERVYTHCK